MSGTVLPFPTRAKESDKKKNKDPPILPAA